MSKHKVSELTGGMLDAAVAMAEGAQLGGDVNPGTPRVPLAYSTDWEYGGPIIERERISVWELGPYSFIDQPLDCPWLARIFRPGLAAGLLPGSTMNDARAGEPDGIHIDRSGQTPLIAAMRALVAAKLGDEVDFSAR